MPAKGEGEVAKAAYSLQMATWKQQQQAAGKPIGPSLPPGVPPAGGSSPSVPSDTLQRGKLALGMQANGSPVDELRTEPVTETAHVLCDFAATGPAELSVSRTLSLAPSPEPRASSPDPSTRYEPSPSPSPGPDQVSRGEFVTVLVGAGREVPDGWCHCQVCQTRTRTQTRTRALPAAGPRAQPEPEPLT